MGQQICAARTFFLPADHLEAETFRGPGKPRTSKPLKGEDPIDGPANEAPEYVVDAPELPLSLLLESPSVKIVGFSATIQTPIDQRKLRLNQVTKLLR